MGLKNTLELAIMLKQLDRSLILQKNQKQTIRWWMEKSIVRQGTNQLLEESLAGSYKI